MEKNDIALWSDITFKTHCYRKNYDLSCKNDNIITENEGEISVVRMSQHKPPLTIGEYSFSVWNIELGKKLGVNIKKLIKDQLLDNTYNELLDVVNNKQISINNLNRLILIHSLILHPDYRKHEITEEFMEFIYRDYYSDNNHDKIMIIALVRPFQNNPIDANYFLNEKSVTISENLGIYEKVSAKEYYLLNNFLKKDDKELNEYKIFSVANKCGFNRIGDSHLFLFSPEKIFNRLIEKNQEMYKLIPDETV